MRFKSDLECMAVPVKFRKLGTFYRYYTGEKVAPVPTIFIGGVFPLISYLKCTKKGQFLQFPLENR